MMGPKLTIDASGVLDLREFPRANLAIALTGRPVKIAGLWLFAIVAFHIPYVLFWVSSDESSPVPISTAVSLVIFLSLPLLLLFALFSASKRQYQANATLREPTRYTFSDEGVVVEAETASARMAWTNYHGALETAECFLLFPTPSISYVVPKRFFRDASQVAAMRSLLRKGLPPSARLKLFE